MLSPHPASKPFAHNSIATDGTRFQRSALFVSNSQPAGLGWYERRLWRSAMRRRRSVGPVNQTRNVQSS